MRSPSDASGLGPAGRAGDRSPTTSPSDASGLGPAGRAGDRSPTPSPVRVDVFSDYL
jgi:hypothetical protein